MPTSARYTFRGVTMTPQHDARGLPVGSPSASARAAVDVALWRMMAFYDTPLADLDAAIEADPGWALPHTMKAGHLASLTETSLLPEAAQHLEAARALTTTDSPARERAHLEAVQHLLDGRWLAACRIWDALLIEHPRDALALQSAQLWDFYRGDLVGLRARPARALPEWDEHDPLFPHVLALWAFGLEENHCLAQAEEAGRRAHCRSGTRPIACSRMCLRCMPSAWKSATSMRRPKRPAAARSNSMQSCPGQCMPWRM